MSDLRRYGPWALVTGASAGIGEAFAEAIAGAGLNVVLTARRRERLDTLAQALGTRYGVMARSVSLNLAEAGATEVLASAIEDLDIGMVVNNAGFGAMGKFETHDPVLLEEMIRLNCVAPVLLTHKMLPKLCKRSRSAVVFVASLAAYQGSPYMACYSGTKAFDLIFGEGLAAEMAGTGVDVLVVSPGATETEFQKVAGAVPHRGDNAMAVAREALASLGRKHTVVTGFTHKIQAASGRFFPRRFVTWSAAKILRALTPPERR